MLTDAYIDDLQIHGVSPYGLRSVSLGSPAPRAVIDLRPTDHGATDATNYYGPRTIEVIGVVSADSMAELWAAIDNLKGKLVLGSYHTFKFRREGLDFDEQVTVRVDSPVDVPLTTIPSPFIEFGVSLLAPDPRIYSSTLNSGSYDPTDSGTGGLFFPLAFPLEFNTSDGAGRLTVVNEGNMATPPVFITHGPVTNPIIDNDTTGRHIYTQELELDADSSLTIDVAARTVLLNGTTSRPDLISPSLTDWFYLVPGNNQLRLRGSEMSAGTTELAVSYRSANI